MRLSDELAKAFDIQVINDKQRIWFFRTKAGLFYYDFF